MPDEAEVVRKIFKLYLQGKQTTGLHLFQSTITLFQAMKALHIKAFTVSLLPRRDSVHPSRKGLSNIFLTDI